jgi:Protein of unknown function DUF262/Restriction Enzyme Adenine Methylase Associated
VAGERVNDQIFGKTLTVREIFSGRHFGLDSYQREYAWTEKQVEDLINDLTRRFTREWSPQHELKNVAKYQPYFLGPVITSRVDGLDYLIDGQQRLSTLMLLLIWLRRIQDGREDAVEGIDPLIYSAHFGEKLFTVDDPERRQCLHALLNGTDFDVASEQSASVRNIWERFADIERLFPEDLRDEELPFFIYWLLDRVTLVEISTGDSGLALEIFETMNDRGLRLTSLDLLKSFILTQLDTDDRRSVNQVWRSRLTDLTDIDSNAHSAFVKSWLRAKYSSGSDDDESIGSAFDKWVRKSAPRLDLDRPSGAREFILRDMNYLAGRYRELLLATRTLTPSLEPVYYNAFNSVTLQLPLILATLCTDDDDATFQRKATLVSGYLDIFVARSMVNAHDFRYATVEHRLFALAREIRGMDADTLAKRLGEEVAEIPENFDAVSAFALRPRNRMYVKYLLARVAAWLDARCMTGFTFAHYTRSGKDQLPYEIEHVWADKFAYQPSIPRRRFADLRNRLGALLLLPKDFNASFGDMPYGKKLPKYMGQNLLARSLHPDCYQNNPTFLRMVKEYELPFQPFPDAFDPATIDSRQELYRRLCEIVWDPTQHGLVMPTEAPRRLKVRDRMRFDITLRQLVEYGHLPAGSQLIGTHRGSDHKAVLTDQARIRIESGEEFEAASPAAMAVLDRQSWNGWKFWQVVQPDGSLLRLDDVRKRAMQQEQPGDF